MGKGTQTPIIARPAGLFDREVESWTDRYASVRTLGGRPRKVGFVQVSDPQARQSFELDVVAEADGEKVDGKPVLLAIGEAKSSDAPRTVADIARLERLRGLLAARAEVGRARLLLFSRSGFDADVITHARRRGDVELVDLARLYDGD